MVLDPSPWFVLFVQLEVNGNVANTFLRHIDEELQSRALKSLRASSGQLNQKTLKLTARKCDRLRERALREALDRAVGDWDSYIQKKKTFTSTVGYENGGHILRLTFEEKPDDGHIHEWVDAALGLPVQLQAQRAERIDNRFSIPIPIKDLGPVILQMSPPGTPGHVRIAPDTEDGRVPVVLKTVVFSTALNPNIPEKYFRIRLSCGPLDFFLDLQPSILPDGHAQLRMSTSWNYECTSLLDDIIRAAEALVLMSSGTSLLSVWTGEDQPTCDSPVGEMSRVVLPSEKLSELRLLASLSALTHAFELSDVRVSSGELVGNILPWAKIGILLSGNMSDISMKIGMTEQATDEGHETAAVIMCPTARLGSTTVTVVGAFVGDLNLLADLRTLDLAPSTARVFRTYDSPVEHDTLVKDVLEFSSSLEAEGHFVVRPTDFLN